MRADPQEIVIHPKDGSEAINLVSRLDSPVRFEAGFVIVTIDISESEQRHLAFNGDTVLYFSVTPIP